jgi:hypothetical protein
MQCRLCNNASKLVKAHIIPESFFRVLRIDDKAPLIISDVADHFPARSPIGVYDEEILCETCEPKFDRFDDYGTEVLLKRKEQLFQPVPSGDKTIAFQADGIDQKLLLQFLVAVLWRASVSTQPFYKRVNLGAFEDVARSMILNPDQPVPTAFGAVLSSWIVTEKQQTIANGIMDPFAERWGDGINAYRVYFGQMVAYIKVDRRPFPAPLSKFALLVQNQVALIARDFGKSKDFAVMSRTAICSHENAQRRSSKRRVD